MTVSMAGGIASIEVMVTQNFRKLRRLMPRSARVSPRVRLSAMGISFLSHIVQPGTQLHKARTGIVCVGHEYFRHQRDIDKRRHSLAIGIGVHHPPDTG